MSAGLGAAIKLQPGIILVWALLTRRWTAVLFGGALLVVLAVAATLLAGVGAWSDFVVLLGQVADPITTPRNVTPGAIAFQSGASEELASIVQWGSVVLVVGVVVAAARWATAEASYLVAVVASQLLSPILWDHYAILLLLPVAYLCAGGRWWALLIPVLTATPIVLNAPPAIYPVAFALALVATLFVGVRSRDRMADRHDGGSRPVPSIAWHLSGLRLPRCRRCSTGWPHATSMPGGATSSTSPTRSCTGAPGWMSARDRTT